ncbi:hypothetical protein BGW80DRAFT_1493282, partial [Lactifluus volemus]
LLLNVFLFFPLLLVRPVYSPQVFLIAVLFSRCIPGPTCFLSPPALPACLSYLPPPPRHHSLPPPLSPASFPALPCCCRHEEITRASDLLLTLASPCPSLPLDVSGSPNAKTLLRLWSRSTNRN